MESGCKRSAKRGFALLELLIAVAILSIGIVAVMQAFSFAARSAGLSGDVVGAVLLAKDKFQELEFKEAKGLIGKEPARVKDKKNKFAWDYAISADTGLNLYKLDLEISWQRGNRKEELAWGAYLR